MAPANENAPPTSHTNNSARESDTERATRMGTKKMPPPMTLETTMAAASSGPSRRSSEALEEGVTRDACRSFADESARDSVLADLFPLDRPVLGENLNLGVDKLRVREHLLSRLRAGISELRLD